MMPVPVKQKHPCNYPGCGVATNARYCDKHMPIMEAKRKEYMASIDDRRGTAAERGYDRSWQRKRKRYLSEHPLCVECEKLGRLVTATVVDHIIPHRGNKELFDDVSNWQSLCKPCHYSKTIREAAILNKSKETRRRV